MAGEYYTPMYICYIDYGQPFDTVRCFRLTYVRKRTADLSQQFKVTNGRSILKLLHSKEMYVL